MVVGRKNKSKIGKTTLSLGKRQKAGVNVVQTKKIKKSHPQKTVKGGKKAKPQATKWNQNSDNDSSDNEDNQVISNPIDSDDDDVNIKSDDSNESQSQVQDLDNHDDDSQEKEEENDDSEEEDEEKIDSDEEDNEEDDDDDIDEDETNHQNHSALPAKHSKNNDSFSYTKKPQVNESLSENPPTNRVFVSQLANASTFESLTSFFESNGLVSTDIFLPKGNYGHKGFAFVSFESVESARKAINLSGSNLDGASIVIEFAKPRRGDDSFNSQSGSGVDSDILFVKNLSSSTTKEDIKNHFKGVKDIMIATNDDGSCRGHAFIQCKDSSSARTIKESMNNSDINGENILVDFVTSNFGGRKQSGQFAGQGGNFGARGGFQQNRGRGGFQNRDGNRRDSFGGGNFGRGGRGFSRGRGGFGNRGGPQFNRGGGRPQGKKIQFNDDD